MQDGPWVCQSIGEDGSSKCNGWWMAAEDHRCRKCGAPRSFLAHELQVGQARHIGRRKGDSGHTKKGNRWTTPTSECYISVHSAKSVRGRKAAARLQKRFRLEHVDTTGYIHVEWQRPSAELGEAERGGSYVWLPSMEGPF